MYLQIFDILPLHGVLQPGQSQQVQFSFYGHSGVATEVTAACRVEGGPTYQLRLSGEASEVQYKFSHKQIELGKPVSQLCDCNILCTLTCMFLPCHVACP